jgi:MFS transporter, FHS family, glucose/mannose:H+ symporter
MHLHRTAAETQSLSLINAALFAGFILTGIVCTILGPILPVFIARWTLNDAQAGLFFTTQFAGSLLGVGCSSLILATRGYRHALILGFLFMAAGIAALNSSSENFALLANSVAGLGYGIAIPATNLCVAEIAGARRSASLNILNMAWGVGAILCPILVLTGLKVHRFNEVLFAIAFGSLLLSILFWIMKFEHNIPSAVSSSDAKSEIIHDNVHPIHVPIALAFLFYLYIGTEAGVSGWAAEQASRVGVGASSTLAPMFFWIGLLSGRGISALILSRVKENFLVLGGLLLSALGTVCLLRASTSMSIIFGVTLAGFGLASIYPIFIAWLSKWYGARARRLGGVMFSMAALGGATVPWIIGFVSQHSHSLRVGLLIPLAGCLTMIVLVAALRRRITA